MHKKPSLKLPAFKSLVLQMNLAKRVKQGGVTGVTGGSGCFRLQETELCSKYGVGGYPSIKYFMAGDKTPKDFHGGRQLRELKQFTEVWFFLPSLSLRGVVLSRLASSCWPSGHPGSQVQRGCAGGRVLGEGGQVHRGHEGQDAGGAGQGAGPPCQHEGGLPSRLFHFYFWGTSMKLCPAAQTGSMKPELKQWVVQRLSVLKQLQAL